MNLEEKKLSSESIFDGKVLHVRRDEVALPNGEGAVREYVHHIGAVAILPLTDEGEVILERQFRYPFGDILVEIPAGKLDSPEEDPRKAALRELREETGAVAADLTYLGDYYGSPAILDERIRLYLATGLSFTEQQTDDDEFLEVFRMPLEALVEEVMSGNLPDGKTQVAALRVWAMLKEKNKESVGVETQL
ncbi:MAG: NUDIX hydrolase [Ruminococcaceae bacterium]|nr:NUDIX hydrolase [Oscillospiraceae bacterium]